MSSRPSDGGSTRPPVTQREVWLLGQPPLSDYLDFVKGSVVDGDRQPPAPLVDAWRKANEYYKELEDTESGIADRAERRDLDRALAPLAEEVQRSPYYRSTFDSLPTTFGMVELAKLIVFQKSVTWDFVESVAARIGPDPPPAALFRFCLPLDDVGPEVTIRRAGSRRFVFRSDSMDLRYHGAELFRPQQIHDHQAFGPMAGTVGLVVGFGSNFLNVIRADNRLLLHNGYHRACALLQLGITHAPAIIQTVTTADELEITAKSVVTRDPDFYFRSARPPLLKDFLDPRIRRVLVTPKIVRTIEITYDVKDYVVPE